MPVSPTGATAPADVVCVEREAAVRSLTEQMPRFMRLVHALKRRDVADRQP